MRKLLCLFGLGLALQCHAEVKSPYPDLERAVTHARDFIARHEEQLDSGQAERLWELFEKGLASTELSFLPANEAREFEDLIQHIDGEHILRTSLSASMCVPVHSLTLYMHPDDQWEAIRASAQKLDIERLKANGVYAIGMAEIERPGHCDGSEVCFYYLADHSVEVRPPFGYERSVGWGVTLFGRTPLELDGFRFVEAGLNRFEPIEPTG